MLKGGFVVSASLNDTVFVMPGKVFPIEEAQKTCGKEMTSLKRSGFCPRALNS